MENISIEEYIKDLSPELQEKARACKTTEELLQLAKENKIPLPDEALEAVAGGREKSGDQTTDGRKLHGKTPSVVSADGANTINNH